MDKGREIRIDQYGNAVLSVIEGRKVLLYGNDIEGAYIDDPKEVEDFNANSERVLGKESKITGPVTLDIDEETYHQIHAESWSIPDKYKSIDVKEYLLNKCKTHKAAERVRKEYQMFEERGLIPLLRFLIFLVDYMREKRIVWGVGRGSCVASYSLYLIGIHKVDSIGYELPIEEFLK
jgi:DNA polymerase III alpha subunit